MKKVLTLVLAGMMIFSTMAGCTKKEPEQTSKETTAQKDTTPDYMNATGYPIVKQSITVKVMGQKSPTHGEWKDMNLFKKMEELTGIHIEFDTPIQSAYTEKKNLALASGDLPDVFLGGLINAKDEETYGPQGVFIPLESYVDKYVPSLKKAFEEAPEAKLNSIATDGHMYSLPYIADTKTRAASILYINLDWLKNVGLNKPTTIDEFYNVLKAFKEKDPNKNGQQDEIPLSYFKVNSASTNILYNILLAAYTGQAGGVSFDIKDGKVIYNPVEAGFKEFLTFMNKIYNEGLVDKEIFTQTLQQMSAKYKEGKMGISSTSLSNVIKPGEKANYELLSPLTSSLNSKKVTPKINFVTTGSFVITNKCKYPEAMMRWIDVLYKDVDEAVNGVCGMMNFLGEYGIDWKYGDDTKKTYSRMSKVEGMTPVEYQNKFIAPQNFGKVSTAAVPDNDELLLIKAVQSDKEYHPYMKEVFPTVIRYKTDKQERLTLLENDLNTYVEQMVAKFIVGEEPLTKFDDFVNKIKKDLKVDEIIKIRQEGYDNFNKK